MKTKKITRRVAAVLALMLGVTGLGVAFAAWTQTGTGSGAAQAKSAVASTVTATTPTADLYPGKTGGTVYFSVDNPNPYPVKFTSLTAGAVTSSDPTGCPAGNISVASVSGLSITLAAGASATNQTVSGVTSMLGSAANGCQGVNFTIDLTLNGTSN